MFAAGSFPLDPQLPQLGRALNALAMQEVFDRALRDHGAHRVMSCRVDRIKYRPGRNCTISYQLEMCDQATSRRYQQFVAGRLCGPGEAASRHARNRGRVSLGTACGMPALLVPAMDLFAWFLPNDPKLAALPALCEVVQGHGPALAEAVSAMTGRPTAISDVHARLVQYVPESRACARFDLSLPDGQRVSLFAKLDREDGGATTHRVMQALYDSPASREGRLRTPRPLLWQASTGLHWQQGVPGVPLIERHPLCPPAVGAEIGRLMAALHSTPVDLARHVAGDQLMARPRECAVLLGQVEPDWQPLLGEILARLDHGAKAVRTLPLATLHGDLHPRNILIEGEQLALIDLDGARAGAAVLEVGAWVADGLYRALLAGASLAPVQETAAHMLAAYQAASIQPVNGRLLAWATARALLCDRAYRGVANLKPGRLAIVPRLLTLAALIAERGDLEQALPNS